VSLFNLFESLKSRTPKPQSPAETAAVRKIVDSLDRLDPQTARRLAAFAYILSRVARADLVVTDDETRAMETIIARHGQLPADQAIVVVHMAKHQNLLFGATEDFLVTREFNEISTREEKLALLACLFEVAAAGSLISVAEDNEIRRIASELGLSQEEFLAARAPFRDRLAVLQIHPPPTS
jgi:uncharacterized tellurite resistance protein B-like protein